MTSTSHRGPLRWTPAALVGSVALLAAFARVGSDWEWVVATGDHLRQTGQVPSSVPFAAAPSDGWHNVPVLAEVVASLLGAGGASVMVLWHVVMVLAALSVLVVAARDRGGDDVRVALLLVVLVVGCLPWWGILRLQTFSLPLFALLLLIVVRQAQRADGHVWWVVPLVAVWGNLHGAVLLGVCVLGAYLALGRLRARPAETVAVGLSALAALLATPQGIGTVRYYLSVFDNVAAERGEGLWAPPRLDAVSDVLMLVAIVVTGVVVLRRRRAAWEYVALAGLAVATATASRHGLWLLMLLFVVGAARDAGRAAPAVGRGSVRVGGLVSLVAAALIVAGRGQDVAAVDPEVVSAVNAVAGGRVVLAPSPLVESLAVSGATVWVSNPIDAFAREDQAAYLDFLSGKPGMDRAVGESDVVVTSDRGDAHDRMAGTAGFSSVSCGGRWICWTRP